MEEVDSLGDAGGRGSKKSGEVVIIGSLARREYLVNTYLLVGIYSNWELGSSKRGRSGVGVRGGGAIDWVNWERP